ncbi:hypothetical protein GGQ54_000207 [Naumannella cuiyingiana]|uniref:Uncharacterized protein n=1 Tax=Naumannella cuiyingiana TaxID=1347891 RepID=A0A7Z0D684_9ACTN|nr:hypothetical protein [Naumannella cuiyingiana]NYI69647.1 hypothetical protein [Naumannella cuiyingiana]
MANELWQVLGAFGYGLLSGAVPVFAAEPFVIAARVLGSPLLAAVCVALALGNAAAKTGLLIGLRHGYRLPWLRRRSSALATRVTSGAGVVARVARWGARLSELAARPRWGGPVVALSAACGIPPLYPLTAVVAGTRLPAALFAVAAAAGLTVRFGIVGLGISLLWRG